MSRMRKKEEEEEKKEDLGIKGKMRKGKKRGLMEKIRRGREDKHFENGE